LKDVFFEMNGRDRGGLIIKNIRVVATGGEKVKKPSSIGRKGDFSKLKKRQSQEELEKGFFSRGH